MATLQEAIKFPITESKKDPNKTMKALEWHGDRDVRVVDRPRPMITEITDALIRITCSSICGSDLHLYHKEFGGLYKGDILGHECMGIVEDVGGEVQSLKVGDKVVVSCVIACGNCSYCKQKNFSSCDTTNPSREMEENYGHRTAGFFGYSHLLGGYDGCQAEYVRVPIADINCLKVPENIADEKLVFLSDVLCTAWHANELGYVGEGQTVAVWGCGPVGLLTQMWAKFRGAKRVIAIDDVPYRLDIARNKLGSEVINFGEVDVLTTLRDIVPGGPDVCIDAVGFRFPKNLAHKLQRALKLETDAPTVLHECIAAVKKCGVVSIVGDYYSKTNQFPIGAVMEKGLTLRSGQVPVQRYWQDLLKFIEEGKVDPTFIISHKMPLDAADKGYKIFDQKEENCVKVILKPSFQATTTPTNK